MNSISESASPQRISAGIEINMQYVKLSPRGTFPVYISYSLLQELKVILSAVPWRVLG